MHQRIGRELRSAQHIFDLGCGDCELVRYLADTYGQQVTGIDISGRSFPSYEDIAKNNIKCIRKNAESLGFFRCSIDAVVIMWALHEMEHPQNVLRQAHRVLKRGGKILIVEFPRGSLAQRLWNENYYSGVELENLLCETGFENVQTELIERKQILWIKGYRR